MDARRALLGGAAASRRPLIPGAVERSPSGSGRGALAELALLFLRLGATTFGGPAVHLAMMQDEVVRRRGWLTRDEFLDLLGATNLIPGPNSTEMAIHVGRRRAGAAGLVVAGAAFILPAMLVTLGLAWAYVRFGRLPAVGWLLAGVKPVVIAVVVQALWQLGRAAARSALLAGVVILGVLASVAGAHEIAVLVAGGLASVVARRGPRVLSVIPLGAAAPAVVPFGLGALFLFFLKVGAVLFGSGYVLLAFLRADLVERWGWLSEGQLLDAVAVGQVTPGPVFTTATFIGYVLAGAPGAVVATLGIFLPAFVFVAVSGPLVPRLRRSPVAGAFLDGVSVAGVALMALVTVQLARAAIVDLETLLLSLVSALLLVRFRVNSAWLVLGGALVGLGLRG
jgi:chromate transporter